MRTVYFVTTNPGKVISFQSALAGYPINIYPVSLELNEPQAPTTAAVAGFKVYEAYKQLKRAVAVIDGGFCVPSLGGFPGPYAKYILDTIGINGILRLVGSDRRCYFESTLAYMDGHLTDPMFFSDSVHGRIASLSKNKVADILKEPRPEHLWSDLTFIFIPDGMNRTLGSLTREKYSVWRENLRSRRSYYREFGDWFISR